MTTRQRVALLVRAYPRLFPRTEVMRLLREQLGDPDALDGWIQRDGDKTRIRACAPKIIYHICAGNLAVSALTSIAHGLLLGSRNIVKLPGDRDDSSTRREILDFIRGLPAPLRRHVETHREIDSTLLREADTIIAFGSDETMARLRTQVRWNQKFVAHGHAVSLFWIDEPDRLTTAQARACAIDVLTYDQLGCLSPQAVYVPTGCHLDALGEKLSHALELQWRSLEKKPRRPLPVAARIAEARDLAYALGHRVWLPPQGHLGWTLIRDPSPLFQPSPLHGVIYLRAVAESQLARALVPVAGRISTVGLAGSRTLSSRLENTFLSLGVSRFCAAGRMQFPPLTWHQDGQSPLRDLVTWIDDENSA
jgi:hypothetical protein